MKVRVWNDNIHPYKQTFKGDEIYIPAKKFVMMEEGYAFEFKGSYSPIVVDSDGNHKSEGFKMIRIEHNSDENPEPAKPVNENACMACPYEATSKADLSEHLKTHEHNLVVDEVAEKEMKRRGRKPAA